MYNIQRHQKGRFKTFSYLIYKCLELAKSWISFALQVITIVA